MRLKNVRLGRLAAVALSAVLAVSVSFAANVVVFVDTNYVDYSVGDTGAEASNVVTSLTTLGHNVSTFTGSSAAAWSAALVGRSVLVLPEFEEDPPTNLDAGVPAVVQAFVAGGGHVIVMADYEGVMNYLLGYSTDTDTGEGASNATPFKSSSIFASGPASLPEMNATDAIRTASFPSGGVCAYAFMDGPDEFCTVWTRTQGAGRVTYLAWDWYFDTYDEEDEDDQSALFPIWESILQSAISANGGRAMEVPVLAPFALLGLSLALAGFGMRRVGRRSR